MDFDFESLPLVVEGESKIIRYLGNGKVAIRYKPTIYSFTHNRAGVIEGSDLLRLKASKVFSEVLKKANVPHAYQEFHDDYVIAELVKSTAPKAFKPSDVSSCDTVAPIEIVCKTHHVGTPKHRYYDFGKYPTRDGQYIQPNDPYPEIVVRFDWRNPMCDANGNRLADEVMSESMANWYIDVEAAKKTARAAFIALRQFLLIRNIELQDICFLMNTAGTKIVSEISQDCGRFIYLGESLDKDVWRSGGSHELVSKKWQQILTLIEAPLNVVVDGNDGTGKTTLVQRLRETGLHVMDRGLPTRMTDVSVDWAAELDPGVLFVILDCSVKTCQERLLAAGRSLDEQYHTVPDLTYYRSRFLEIASRLPNCYVANAEQDADSVFQDVMLTLSFRM